MPPKICLAVRRRILNHHVLNVRIQLIFSRLMVLFEANDDCSKSYAVRGEGDCSKSMPFEARMAVQSLAVRSRCRSRRGWLFRAWLFEADAVRGEGDCSKSMPFEARVAVRSLAVRSQCLFEASFMCAREGLNIGGISFHVRVYFLILCWLNPYSEHA